MYEAEVNEIFESIETLPPGIKERFCEFRDQIVGRTILPWGEHCTECVWPVCYTTCELYSPRKDGACRLFVDGMVRIDNPGGLNPYLLKLRFKRWAKLWTVGNLNLQPPQKAARQELFNIVVGAVSRNSPLPNSIKTRVLTKVNYLRRRSAETAQLGPEAPDSFLVECFNPNTRTINLTLTIRPRAGKDGLQFQKLIALPPGYARARVAAAEIFQRVDRSQPFEVEIVPNDCDDTVLYFGLLDFVKERNLASRETPPETPEHKFKCIVWDLDNTLWDGVLIEDGPEKIRMREGVFEVIKETDQRGILHSIASKNNYDDVVPVLRSYGMEDYFLYPQISWQPKSQSIAQIARLLNIGIDSIAFVDDQPFEREEVKAAQPQVTVVDAADSLAIPGRAECQVPVTAESRARRAMYREEEQRQTALESSNGDYLAFLRNCGMKIAINSLQQDNLKRVYELAQRTNQMNFSGNRYKESELTEIMKTEVLETYVIDCSDRFGNYGIVGFAVIDVREPRLLDLMFSCRVQSKRVEHAVLSFMLKRFVEGRNQDFFANYRKTKKNAPSGKVFDEMGFECVGENDGVSNLVFRKAHQILDDDILSVTMAGVG